MSKSFFLHYFTLEDQQSKYQNASIKYRLKIVGAGFKTSKKTLPPSPRKKAITVKRERGNRKGKGVGTRGGRCRKEKRGGGVR